GSLFIADTDTLADVAALGISPDGKSLYAASGKNRTLRIYAIPSGAALADFNLDVTPICLEALSDPAVFRLNQPDGEHTPLLIFDPRAAASVFFVPAPAVGGTEE